MDAIEELLARDRIRQLAERYALAVDGKDVDSITQLFAESATFGRYGSGRVGAMTFFDNVIREFHCSMHLVANHVIDFDDDDHAHGVVYCRAHHHVLEPEYWFDYALAYWDTYERVGGNWFFGRRDIKSWYRQEFGHPVRGTDRVESSKDSEGRLPGTQMPDAFATFEAFWLRPPAGTELQ